MDSSPPSVFWCWEQNGTFSIQYFTKSKKTGSWELRKSFEPCNSAEMWASRSRNFKINSVFWHSLKVDSTERYVVAEIFSKKVVPEDTRITQKMNTEKLKNISNIHLNLIVSNKFLKVSSGSLGTEKDQFLEQCW